MAVKRVQSKEVPGLEFGGAADGVLGEIYKIIDIERPKDKSDMDLYRSLYIDNKKNNNNKKRGSGDKTNDPAAAERGGSKKRRTDGEPKN